MHPREGWSADGTRPGLSRRGFLKQGVGAGLLMGGLGTLLEACGTSTTTTGGAGSATKAIGLPRPNNPVTWPIFTGNHSIASGMKPERDATLQIFNWVAYVKPQTL